MTIRILLISDIHGNYPALQAIDRQLDAASFDYIVNPGDSLVYAPFPNKTLTWLAKHQAISILGNTDKKVIKLLLGKSFKKPGKPDKRIMYTSTAKDLSTRSRRYLLSLTTSYILKIFPQGKSTGKHAMRLGIFHGSPADDDEFLFTDTPDTRFHELAELTNCQIVVTGHSHTPYHKTVANIHFINPGSAGRMFDDDPRASCATLEITADSLTVHHFRIDYDIAEVVAKIRKSGLPGIYATMFQEGKKLN
ncbi:metallophosphoesterase family protein [Desulfocastanea catecholica]